ncbi:MAG: dNTP triphosphohydrolase [Epsilonproteobacteria bacterium]|nr:dNTP triphosphohydrolase [Campylobacterota bacterium]
MLCFKRFYPIKEDFRDPFSRDRDRVVHSSSFRRLEYKTQVFINHEGDYFRTRLTHSLEVAQISRTIALALKLKESLAEAIALSHDLGHTPFGHSGGEELDRTLKEDGHSNGFDHNFQSFRVLTKLEKRYKEYDGLNLTYATLEGVLKHSYPYNKKFLPQSIKEGFRVDYHPSLEAIVVDYADAIAYISADIDDGIKYNLIGYEDLKDEPLIKMATQKVEEEEGIAPTEPLFRHRLVSWLIKILIGDFIKYSSKFVSSYNFEVLCSSFVANEKLPMGHSPGIAGALETLKSTLYSKLYKHHKIVREMYGGKVCVKALYKAFMSEPNLLPQQHRELLGVRKKHRVVADYIASMTDRYALKRYHQIYALGV